MRKTSSRSRRRDETAQTSTACSALAVLCLIISLPSFETAASPKHQLVAVFPHQGEAVLQWMDIRQKAESATVESVADLTVSPADASDPDVSAALGGWADLNMTDIPVADTCRMEPGGSLLYCLVRIDDSTPSALEAKGCCADHLAVYDRLAPPGSGPVVLEYLLPVIRQALAADGLSQADVDSAYATHLISPYTAEDEGGKRGMVLVRVTTDVDGPLGGAFTDAFINLSLDPSDLLSVIKTEAGRSALIPYRDLGTFSTDPADSLYKIQYANFYPWKEAYHANNIMRFSTPQSEQPLLLITAFVTREAVVLTDPWSTERAEILQRFGTPPMMDANGTQIGAKYFGLDGDMEGELYGGVHNAFYSSDSLTEIETVTLFANAQGDDYLSKVYEFALKLVPESSLVPGVTVSDSVFDTEYVKAETGFYSFTESGARPMGRGVYLISDGAMLDAYDKGFKLVDIMGGQTFIPYTATESGFNFYDPFLWVDVQ